MVYKLGNVADLGLLPPIDTATKDVILEYLNILDGEYGEMRDVDNGYGGYVLYCTPGTNIAEVEAVFDMSSHVIEFIEHTYEATPPICTIVYITSCEYGVVLIMATEDLPKEITNTF